jgi:gliding motility-associated-like protein
MKSYQRLSKFKINISLVYLQYLILFIFAEQISGQGKGLLGHYYNNDGPGFNFTAPLTTKRIDPLIQFYWGSGSPIPGVVNGDRFSIRWTGKIVPKVTGNYKFYLQGDDGVRLKVNGKSLINDWRPSGGDIRESNAPLSLTAGKKYDIIIEYYEDGGGALINFSWEAPGLPKEIVPTNYLYPVLCDDINNKILPERQIQCKAGPIQPLTGDFNDLDVYENAYYVWEYSEDSLNWVEINGFRDQDLPVAVYDKDRWYRRLIKSTKPYVCDTISIVDSYLLSISNIAFVKGSIYFAPQVDAGENIYACPGTPVKIGGNQVASGDHPPFQYSWDFGEFLNDETLSNPIAAVPKNTIFTLTVTDAVGCTNLHQMVLYTYPADAGPDKKYCGNQSPLPLGIPANPGEPATYLWSPINKVTCHDCPIAYTNTNINTNFSLIKTVTLPDGSTCQTQDAVFVEVIPPPVRKLEDVIMCYSSDNQIEIGYVPENAFSYEWKSTKFLKELFNSKVVFDCGDIFLDPQGKLGNEKNPNPAPYVLEIKREVCIWTDTLEIFMLRADGGNNCLDGKLGYDWHPQIPATYKWTAVAGPNTIKGPDDKPEVFLDPVDNSSVYQLAVSFRGFDCLSDYYKCSGDGYCDFKIEFDKSCKPRPGLQLRVEGSMSLPLGANPSDVRYEWFPKVGLSNYYAQSVTTTDNVKRKYEVLVTHPARPGYTCYAERVIPETRKPDFDLQEVYDLCKPGDSIEIGISPSILFEYKWEGPDGYDADTSQVTVKPDSLPALYMLTVIDTENYCFTTKSTSLKIAVEANAGEDQTVCPGAIVLLGTPDTSAGRWTYLWDPFYSPWENGTNETSPQPNVLVAKDLIFVLTVTDTSSGCTVTDSVEIFMDPEGPDLIFENVSACLNSEVQLGPDAIPFAQYKWSPADGLSCTDCPNPKLKVEKDNEYTVEIILSGNCGDQIKGVIKVSVFDTTSIVGDRQVKCPSRPGGDIALNPDKLGECSGCTYSWSPMNGLDNSAILNPIVSTEKDQEYVMSVTNEAGCVRDVIIPVRVIETGDLGIDNIEKCLYQSNVYLNPRGLGQCPDCTYSWSPSAGLDDSNILNPITSAGNNTKYTLYSIKPDGCREKLDVTVTILPEVILPSANIEKCPSGDPVPVNSGLSGQCNGCTYAWSPATYLDDPSDINPDSRATEKIDYTLRITKADGCVEKANITVRPVTTFAGVDDAICLGGSAILGDRDNSLTSSYTWTPATDLDNPTARLPKFTPSAGGDFIYKMTEERDLNGSLCILTSQVKIQVEKLAPPDLPQAITICKGTCNQIGVDSLSGFKYQWSGTSGIDCSNCADITICPENKSSYKLTIVKLSSGCSASTETYVDIADIILPEFELPDLAACTGRGDKIIMNPLPSIVGDYAIRWSPESFFDKPNENNPKLLVDSLESGVNFIKLHVDDKKTGCKNISFLKEVKIFDPSEVRNQSEQICKDITLTSIDIALPQFNSMFINDSLIDISYYFKKDDAENQLSQILDFIRLQEDTSFFVRVDYPNADCYVVASLDLDIKNSYSTILQTNLCEGETYSFENTELTKSGSYTFSHKTVEGCDSIIIVELDIQSVEADTIIKNLCRGDSFSFKGKQYVEPVILLDTLDNRFGCDSIRSAIIVEVRELPHTKLYETQCGSYKWKHNSKIYDVSGIYTDTIQNLLRCDSIVSLHLAINPEYYFKESQPSICREFLWDKTGQKLTKSGVYYHKNKTANGGCDSIYQLNLTVYPEYRIEKTVDVFEKYYWPSSDKIYEESGEYSQLFYTKKGCDSLLTLSLRVKKYGKLWMPNIFSPNADGSNDKFVVFSNPEVQEIKLLRIYNRTGHLVFEKMNFVPNDPDSGWDGTFQNSFMGSGVYTFFVVWEDEHGFNSTQTGTLQLIR